MPSREPSPDPGGRKLSPIPEATPGPNAFAQRAAAQDRHQMDSNAFYQEAIRSRNVTPSSAIHPAFRTGYPSDSTVSTLSPVSPLSPASPPAPRTHAPRTHAHNSGGPGIGGGETLTEMSQMRLVPSHQNTPVPTQRAFFEQSRELATPSFSATPPSAHKRSISAPFTSPRSLPQIPGYPCSSVFGNSQRNFEPHPGTYSDLNREFNRAATPEPTPGLSAVKTPKKSLLSKLGLGNSKTADRQPATNRAEEGRIGDYQGAPQKALALLGGSGHRRNRLSLGGSPSSGAASRSSSPQREQKLVRSSSKHKGLFGRKQSTDPAPMYPLPPSFPPRISSSTTPSPHDANFSSSIQSQSTRERGQLRFPQGIDRGAVGGAINDRAHGVQPTEEPPPPPPPKNTPPDQRQAKHAGKGKERMRMPFQDSTSQPQSPSEGNTDTSDPISPIRFNGRGRREVPRLVTQPSMHSLHASVVPQESNFDDLNEMQARMGSLALEGFSMPSENSRSQDMQAPYSPSVYSTDRRTRRSSMFQSQPSSARQGQFADRFSWSLTPTEAGYERRPSRNDIRDDVSTTSASVPLVYPDLRKDPSWINQLPGSQQAEVEDPRPPPGHRHAPEPAPRRTVSYHRDTWTSLTGFPGPSQRASDSEQHRAGPAGATLREQHYEERSGIESPTRRRPAEIEDIEWINVQIEGAGQIPNSNSQLSIASGNTTYSHESAVPSPLQTHSRPNGAPFAPWFEYTIATPESLSRLGLSSSSSSHQSSSTLLTLPAATYAPPSRRRRNVGFGTPSRLSQQVANEGIEAVDGELYDESPTLGRPQGRLAPVSRQERDQPEMKQVKQSSDISGPVRHHHVIQDSAPSESNFATSHSSSPEPSPPHSPPLSPSRLQFSTPSTRINTSITNIVDSAPRLLPSPVHRTMAADTPTRSSRSNLASGSELNVTRSLQSSPVYRAASPPAAGMNEAFERIITRIDDVDARTQNMFESLGGEMRANYTELRERIDARQPAAPRLPRTDVDLPEHGVPLRDIVAAHQLERAAVHGRIATRAAQAFYRTVSQREVPTSTIPRFFSSPPTYAESTRNSDSTAVGSLIGNSDATPPRERLSGETVRDDSVPEGLTIEHLLRQNEQLVQMVQDLRNKLDVAEANAKHEE